ncbi:MAG TPA: hypothetical protein VEM32_01030, partial [Geobacteraceae bacterium]|nr:hypothetical protein [Geobacteraceae bacterium]
DVISDDFCLNSTATRFLSQYLFSFPSKAARAYAWEESSEELFSSTRIHCYFPIKTHGYSSLGQLCGEKATMPVG